MNGAGDYLRGCSGTRANGSGSAGKLRSELTCRFALRSLFAGEARITSATIAPKISPPSTRNGFGDVNRPPDTSSRENSIFSGRSNLIEM